MLKIDLLKGQGIPIKSRPAGAALLAITFTIPILIALGMGGDYLRSRILITTKTRFLKGYEKEISNYSDIMKFQSHAQKKITRINSTLEEVAHVIQYQVQWSDILEEIAKMIPAKLVLLDLNVRTESVLRPVPRQDDPTKNITITIPRRILQVGFYGGLDNQSDKAAMQYLADLRSSKVLGSAFESIRSLSQVSDEKENTKYYSIECVSKVSDN